MLTALQIVRRVVTIITCNPTSLIGVDRWCSTRQNTGNYHHDGKKAAQFNLAILFTIECAHDCHVGGLKQYNDFPLGNIFYFYANIFYCFSPPTWPPCTHSVGHYITLYAVTCNLKVNTESNPFCHGLHCDR